jgi:hypothetical protein
MKRLISAAATVLAIITISTPARAGWVQVGEHDNGNRYYIDDEQIIHQGKYAYYWARLDTPYEIAGIKRFQTRYIIDCSQHLQKPLQGFYYNSQGRVVKREIYTSNSQVEWEAIMPGTYNEIFFNEACPAS